MQWPTFVTLLMFPVLLVIYRKLAIREEREVAAEFGADWEAYATDRPRFLPRLRQFRQSHTVSPQVAKPVPEARPMAEAKPARSRERVGSGGTRRRRP